MSKNRKLKNKILAQTRDYHDQKCLLSAALKNDKELQASGVIRDCKLVYVFIQLPYQTNLLHKQKCIQKSQLNQSSEDYQALNDHQLTNYSTSTEMINK